ncbi:PAS domain-containing sensor histidine kinase [Knoellia locipacati]|uniref:histidine kinase n=1 Tax=Knoellia locipacati TaxID=882824 RepID=A0A512SWC0_9MICO|nr:sensor histidine kinase [Knoellia locipacati]GEQ12227.1 histidine kinase [Knoellia locipacati]
MSTLAESLRASTTLEDHDIEWVHLVVGDWQLIADLAFADLVLWVPTGLDGWRAVAHVRPNTGPMVFYDDVVGRTSGRWREPILSEAYRQRRIVNGREPEGHGETAVREQAIPVVREGRALAVITRHSNVITGRTPSRLELTYRLLAESMTKMIAAGEFPSTAAPTGARRGAPRVGDGVVHLDVEGTVLYASPNAISAIHRLGHRGDVIGEVLATVVADLLQASGSTVDESLAVVITGRAPWWTEVSTQSASVSLRAIPLTDRGTRQSAMLLLRDVSELRRREQELITKDATIREIHHRVKNNLQTVAALLRLQSRRVPDEGARNALDEAVRRVGTIALVHETLSQGIDETVNFDEIALRGLRAVVDVAVTEHRVESTLTGSFGRMRAEDATSLAMIVSELVQNAVEHGLASRGGVIRVHVDRAEVEPGVEGLTVTITDDGTGLPAGFRPVLAGLGTRIVTSLVQDLQGRIRWEPATPHGTRVEFTARLRPLTR